MSEPLGLWVDGVPAAAVPAASRGLHYADGIFRTGLKYRSELIDLDKHLEKASDDARRLGMAPPAAEVLRAEVSRCLAAGPADAVFKLLLVRAAGGRGYRADSDAVQRILLAYAPPAYPEHLWSAGIRTQRGAFLLAAQPALAGIKHLARLEQVLASRDWPPDCDEVLLGDAAGNAVGGSRSNLFFVRGGELCTPQLGRCGVAGVMRAKILDLARGEGIVVRSADWQWAELEEADEVFVCNSLIGIWPVRAMGPRELAAPGPLTARLARVLRHPRLAA